MLLKHEKDQVSITAMQHFKHVSINYYLNFQKYSDTDYIKYTKKNCEQHDCFA